MQGGCGRPAGGRDLRGGRGVADRGGAAATDGDRHKTTDAHPCKTGVTASVTEIRREKRKTGGCLNAAWETIPSRYTPALSGGVRQNKRDRTGERKKSGEVKCT